MVKEEKLFKKETLFDGTLKRSNETLSSPKEKH